METRRVAQRLVLKQQTVLFREGTRTTLNDNAKLNKIWRMDARSPHPESSRKVTMLWAFRANVHCHPLPVELNESLNNYF